jgi:hypothetical protein
MPEKRIYAFVTESVQYPLAPFNPLKDVNPKTRLTTLRRCEETRTIVQPPGRIAAQEGHVVSKMRVLAAMEEVDQIFETTVKRGLTAKHLSRAFLDEQACNFQQKLATWRVEPITTIVLRVRNTFELHHIEQLLQRDDIRYQKFWDDQEGEYEHSVTAVATYPLEDFLLIGVSDYLDLWGMDLVKRG